jgi:hypothetical protein
MAYSVRCDGCTLEREFADWADATWYASDHEAKHPDHWVSIYELQEA